MGFLLFYRVEGMVIKNTTKPSPEQLRRGSAFDHIKCHRQVWNTWGGRGSKDVRKGIRIERKPLKTAKKCRKNIAVVLCLLRRSFCVRFLGLTHTLTHTANVQRAAERMIVSSSPPLSTFLHDLRHEIAHLFCCTFLHLARDVRVSAEREARIEVSEHTRYGFHVHAVLQCQGRECVPLRYNYDKPEKP